MFVKASTRSRHKLLNELQMKRFFLNLLNDTEEKPANHTQCKFESFACETGNQAGKLTVTTFMKSRKAGNKVKNVNVKNQK